MHTLVLNVHNETVMEKLKAFISLFQDSITLEKDIELLSSHEEDYKTLIETKRENNPSYSLEEAKKLLGFVNFIKQI